MKIKIVYDNTSLPKFKSAWGFSALIEDNHQKILFDTGWDPKTLKHNLRKFDIKINGIDIIFLSHPHWDHIGALPTLLREETKVITPQSFSKNLKKEINKRSTLIETTDIEKITENSYTTGEIGQKPPEQSLLIKKNGLILITGCCHPGLKKVIKKSQQIGKVKTIIGGLHASSEFDFLDQITKIAPCHCTKNKEKIKKLFPSEFSKCYAGKTLKF